MLSDDFAPVMKRILKKARTYPPMPADVVDAALATVGIRNSPAYREFLLRTNGADMRNIAFFAVGAENDHELLDLLADGLNESKTAHRITYSGAYCWAWDLATGGWARYDGMSDEVVERYDSDEAMLTDAFDRAYVR